MPVLLRRFAPSIAGLTLVALAMPGAASAADTVWSGSSSNAWGTAANWSGGVPVTGDHAFLPGGASNLSILLPGAVNLAKQLIVQAAYTLSGPAGAALTLSDNLFVEGSGAQLLVNAVTAITSPNGTVGLSSGSSGNSLTVSGSGASVNVNTDPLNSVLRIGHDGINHLLKLEANAAVTAANLWLGVASTASNNAILVTQAGSVLSATTKAVLGYGGSSNTTAVSNGGRLDAAQLILGLQTGANSNALVVKDSGSQVNLSGSGEIGSDGSSNQVSVQSGGTFTKSGSGDLVLGANAGSSSNTLTVTGGTLTFSSPIGATLVVGNNGTANLFKVEQGGTANTGNARIGKQAGSDNNQAIVTDAGSNWNVAGTLRVGENGNGNSLAILNGGAVTLTENAKNLFIGQGLNSSDNSVSVSGSGSTLTVDRPGSEVVISNGLGTNNKLLLLDSGTANVLSIQIGPSGTLQFGNGGASGSLNSTATINGNSCLLCSTGGSVVFNHSDTNLTIANTLSGPLKVRQEGSGKTTLTATNTYSGNTEIVNGTLALVGTTNPIASSAIIDVGAGATLDVTGASGGLALASGQTLGGSGDILGDVTVSSGSTLAPGLDGIGTLTFHNDLTIAGTLALDLGGTTADRIVAQALNLQPGSQLQFNLTSPLTLASYLLADYASLTGLFDSVGGLPGGYYLSYNYLGQNQIALVRNAPTPLPLVGLGAALGWSRRMRRRIAAR